MCDKKGKIQSTCHLEVDSPMSTTEEQSGLGLYSLKSRWIRFQVQLLLEGKPVSMKVDTGSAVSMEVVEASQIAANAVPLENLFW